MAGGGRRGPFAFTLPNSPSSSCCLRVSRFGLLQPSRRWADDRDEMCDDRIDPCHIAGVGRFCATTAATTAGETRRRAAAAEARRRTAAAKTRRRAGHTGRGPRGHQHPPVRGNAAVGSAYPARPDASRVCSALPKPKRRKPEREGRKADLPYVFAPPPPPKKVKNGVSVPIGYPFKTNSEATAE